MSVIKKPDLKIFAQDAKTGEIESFPDILRGWGITLERTAGKPPLEWFNAIGKRVDEWLMYLTQRGVAEWDASLSYPKTAIVQFNSIVYVSVKETKGEQPDKSQASWSTLGLFLGLDKYSTTAAMNLELNKKFDKANISGVKGNENDKVPSLNLLTTEVGKLSTKAELTSGLNTKLNTSNVVQSTGTSTTQVMSQDSATKAIADAKKAGTDANSNANNRVPDTRKVNNKALNSDITLNASDVEAISTSDITNVTGSSKTKVLSQEAVTAYLATKMSNTHSGQVNNSNKLSDFLETGFYQVMVDTSKPLPSDHPKNSDGITLYGYGFLEVRKLSSLVIDQVYRNNFGDVAIRQSWDGGVNWSNGGWRIVSQDLATTSGASNSKGITQKAITNMMFGIEQSWKNLTTSRSKDTEYTNTSTKIRTVSVSTTTTGNTVSSVQFYINGNLIASANSRFSDSEKVANLTIPVPPGDKYKVTGSGSVLIWSEL